MTIPGQSSTSSDLRLVSFLPAATEMACALGLTEAVVGVSHECNYPPAMQDRPVVVQCAVALDELSLRDIDTVVAERIGRGESLYTVDEQLLESLAPTHILTQALCDVCAPSGNEITRALGALPSAPHILWFSPHSLDDIFDNLRTLGETTGRGDVAEQLIAVSRARLQGVARLTGNASHRPRVFCLEWIDPYYCCGHWVPEMIDIAGGQDALGRTGTDSVRTSWSEIATWAPEVLIVAPCGFGIDEAVAQAQRLLQEPGWSDLPAVRNHRVFAVDANAYFARPGPRVVDGTELLAHLIHPDLCAWTGPADAFRQIAVDAQLSRPARMKVCTACGVEFVCGPQSNTTSCWCDAYPPVVPLGESDCLCPACLAARSRRDSSQ